MRQFTDKEMKELSQWERLFHTAVNASWASNPGRVALERIAAIYEAATDQRISRNYSCGACVLRLLVDTGRLYFAQQAAKKEQRSGNRTTKTTKTKNKTI